MENFSLISSTIRTELTRLSQSFDETLVERYAQRVNSLLPLDATIEQIIYNVSFWTQALLKDEKTIIRYDDPNQIIYPWEETDIAFISPDHVKKYSSKFPTDFLKKFFSQRADTFANLLNTGLHKIPTWLILKYLIENLNEVLGELEPLFHGTKKVLENGNLIVLSNHASWMNLPLIAALLSTYGGIPKEKIYTLLGPAITTRELSFSGIVNYSNLIKTVPDTKNGNIEAKELIDTIRRNMFKEVKRLFMKQENIGNIFLIAPSGTTDTFYPKENRFELENASAGTHSFLRRLAKEEFNYAMNIGINDKAIMPNNTAPKRGKALIKKSTVVSGPEKTSELLLNLPKYVIGETGKIIGSWKPL